MSNLSPSVLEARQRAARYRDADGLSGIVTGAAFFLMGSQNYFASRFRPLGSLAHVLSILLFLCVPAVLFLKSEGILDWAKAHLTYPRSGYVPAPSLLEGIESSKDQRKLPRALFMLDATVYLYLHRFCNVLFEGPLHTLVGSARRNVLLSFRYRNGGDPPETAALGTRLQRRPRVVCAPLHFVVEASCTNHVRHYGLWRGFANRRFAPIDFLPRSQPTS